MLGVLERVEKAMPKNEIRIADQPGLEHRGQLRALFSRVRDRADIHVIEHISRPVEFLPEIHGKLKQMLNTGCADLLAQLDMTDTLIAHAWKR